MAETGMVERTPVRGTELTTMERGTGDNVIFVHGSLGDYRSWMRQVEAFAPKYRAVSYSRRYHDPNPWSGGGTDYTVGLHADDLIALIEALKLAPVHAVGNSFGAYTILMAATRRPELFRKLVIGEPPVLPWLKEIPGGQPYWDDFMSQTWNPAAQAFQQGQLAEGVSLFIDGVSGQPGYFNQLPEAARERMLANARSLSAETASPDYFTKLTPQMVTQITNPMLLLRGEHSPKMFHLVMDRLAEYARYAQQATIPAASHSMPSSNPAAYNQVVMDFLG